jgi:hypothetical protein
MHIGLKGSPLGSGGFLEKKLSRKIISNKAGRPREMGRYLIREVFLNSPDLHISSQGIS